MANSAFSWRSPRDGGKLQSEAALRRQIETDTHPPGEYRSDTVRNVEAWYKAYRDRARRQTLSEARRSCWDMVTPLRIAFVEWPEALSTTDAQWDRVERLRQRRAS